MPSLPGAQNPNFRHGGAGTPTYVAWKGMRNRCLNSNEEQYKDYGGRGISICSRWDSFENFRADIGDRPKGAMLERDNNDGDYEPSNCRWATRTEQNRNRRSIRHILVDGEMLCAAEAARRIGLTKSALYYRLDHGWSDADLLLPATR